jgi:hypothetical protein
MTAKHEPVETDPNASQALVRTELELDQLVAAKKHHLPRRRLTRLERVVLWALRIYVVLMVAVVIYQIVTQ